MSSGSELEQEQGDMRMMRPMRLKRLLALAVTALMVAGLLFATYPRIIISPGSGVISISLGAPLAKADVGTNSPSSSTAGWTNPTNAYADDASRATITSGSPSANSTWGDYGFSLGSATIDGVRVRYDTYSAGTVQSVTRQATADNGSSGMTGSPYFSKINDSSDATMIVNATNGASNYAMFNYTAFTVPTGSTIQSVAIHYRHRSTTTGAAYAHGSGIRLNGTIYGRGQTAGWDAGSASGVGSGSAIADVVYTGTTNPSTGAVWTVAAVNAITGFGVVSNDANPDSNFYQADITVNYTEYNDIISVQVSWDGGTSWSTANTSTVTNAEATYWAVVTGVTAWTPTKLNDANFKVRAYATLVNNAEVVNLDWLPVEVTYTPGTPEITVSPTSYDFGVIAESITSNTTTSYFTIDNTSTMQTDQTISVTASSWSGGAGWTHSDTATPGADTAGMKANKGGTWGTGDVIVKNAAPNFIAENQAAVTDYSFGLSLITPTSFTDGIQKSNTVRITAAEG